MYTPFINLTMDGRNEGCYYMSNCCLYYSNAGSRNASFPGALCNMGTSIGSHFFAIHYTVSMRFLSSNIANDTIWRGMGME